MVLNPGNAGADPVGMVLDRKENILIAGTFGKSAGVIRLTPAGVLDRTFGVNGLALAPSLGNGPTDGFLASGLALDNAGNIYVDEMGLQSAVAKFLPNGKIDPSFGTSGTLLTSNDLYGGNCLALEPNGLIIVGGSDLNFATTEIARYNSNGLDPTFGVVQLSPMGGNYPGAPFYPPVTVLAVQPNGDILATDGMTIWRVLGS